MMHHKFLHLALVTSFCWQVTAIPVVHAQSAPPVSAPTSAVDNSEKIRQAIEGVESFIQDIKSAKQREDGSYSIFIRKTALSSLAVVGSAAYLVRNQPAKFSKTAMYSAMGLALAGIAATGKELWSDSESTFTVSETEKVNLEKQSQDLLTYFNNPNASLLTTQREALESLRLSLKKLSIELANPANQRVLSHQKYEVQIQKYSFLTSVVAIPVTLYLTKEFPALERTQMATFFASIGSLGVFGTSTMFRFNSTQAANLKAAIDSLVATLDSKLK